MVVVVAGFALLILNFKDSLISSYPIFKANFQRNVDLILSQLIQPKQKAELIPVPVNQSEGSIPIEHLGE